MREKSELNRENLRKVYEIMLASERSVKAGGEKFFDYSVWSKIDESRHETVRDAVEHPCGTVGCIGGWALILRYFERDPDRDLINLRLHGARVLEEAADWSGLTIEDGEYLFLGGWCGGHFGTAFDQVKAKVEDVLATGLIRNPRIDWNSRNGWPVDSPLAPDSSLDNEIDDMLNSEQA